MFCAHLASYMYFHQHNILLVKLDTVVAVVSTGPSNFRSPKDGLFRSKRFVPPPAFLLSVDPRVDVSLISTRNTNFKIGPNGVVLRTDESKRGKAPTRNR